MRWADSHFRLAVESAPHATVIVDSDGSIILANAQAERLLGYTRQELLGQPIEILVPERFRARHPDFRAGFFANPSIRAMGVGRDLYARRKDGKEVPVEIGLTPIKSDQGDFVLSAIVDITTRKQAEQMFRLAVESAPNAMVMVNDKGLIVLINAQTEQLFGYPRAELLGQPIELLVPERLRTKHAEFRLSFFGLPSNRAMGAGRDLHGRRKDGSEFPVEIGLNPVETEQGLMVLSAIVDITTRKRAEAELLEARAELEKRVQDRTLDLARLAVDLRAQAELLDLAHDAIVVRRLDGRITFWNRGAEEVYGWTKSEAEGQPTHTILRTEFPRPLAELEQELLRNGRWEGTLVHYRKDGSKIFIASRWALKNDEHGVPSIVLEINNDITERQLAEDKAAEFAATVHRSNQELAAANKELEAFSYSISHDLRAPLRAIDGFSRILLQQHAAELSDEAREYLQDVRMNTQRMGQLVDDLLAFSRLSRQAIKKEVVNTVKVVQQCWNELQPQRENRRVEFHLADLPLCHADRSLLKQVWINLLSNALKYSSKREVATIEVGSQTGSDLRSTTFFIKDNGVGFDMRYVHKLFGVFQRLHRTEDYEGTGVGLAIVQRIVNRHGGQVRAEAQPDQGATFFFTLEGGDLSHG